jgi:hypothetical protein
MGGTLQPWMGSATSQAPPLSPDDTQPTGTTVLPSTADLASNYPSAYPVQGSTADLENQAKQAPQQLGQALQQQQQAQPQSDYSPNNPHTKLVNYFNDQLTTMGPPATGGGVKRLLTNFFQGMGGGMMVSAGLTPPDIRRQQLVNNLQHSQQMADQWEEMQGLMRYRDVLANGAQQQQQYESQMQPLRLQAERQAVTAGQQAATTIHPAMSAGDLKALGVPDDLAKQYEGKSLTSADFTALKDLSAAGATRIFDYGQSGQGQGRGQWLVDKNFNPVKQVSPISESGSARDLQKQQFAQQNAMLKASGQLVVAYDPLYKNPNGTPGGNVVMSQADAQQRGLQHYKADPSNLNATIAGFNDVQQKINMLAEVTNDRSRMGQVDPQLAAQLLHHGHGITFGAFGTTLDTSQINERLYATELSRASQATKDYVTAMGAAHEALTQLPRLQTFGKSSRVTEKQMEAAQNMLPQPGDAGDPSMAQQKMVALQTTLDPLRKQLPHMQGAELLPTWAERRGQTSVRQSTGTSGGFDWSAFPIHQTPQ